MPAMSSGIYELNMKVIVDAVEYKALHEHVNSDFVPGWEGYLAVDNQSFIAESVRLNKPYRTLGLVAAFQDQFARYIDSDDDGTVFIQLLVHSQPLTKGQGEDKYITGGVAFARVYKSDPTEMVGA